MQGLDRYAYTNNNPIRYTDPSGHNICDEEGNCTINGRKSSSIRTGSTTDFTFEEQFGISFDGETWTEAHKNAVKAAVVMVGTKLAGGGDAAKAFNDAYGHINFTWGNGNTSGGCADPNINSGGCTSGSHQINFWTMSGDGSYGYNRAIKNGVHELGEAYYAILGKPTLSSSFSRDALRPNEQINGNEIIDWQQHPPSMNVGNEDYPNELFSDTFIAWTYDAWNPLNVDAALSAQIAMDSFIK